MGVRPTMAWEDGASASLQRLASCAPFGKHMKSLFHAIWILSIIGFLAVAPSSMSMSQYLSSSPKFSPWAQKSVPWNLGAGRARPTSGPSPERIGNCDTLITGSICSPARATVLIHRNE
jgi:hypothetical protein